MNLEIFSNFSKQSDPFQQKAVLEYFNSLKNNPFGWKICAETLLTESVKDEAAIFFCFQVIEDYIKSRYSQDNEENRRVLIHLILSLFDKNLFTSNYLQNKYAHLVNSIFLLDFPSQKWNTFFKDFLGRCEGKVKCDLFLRILIQINLDIADREIPRSQKELNRNTLIKDVMRETCLVDLAQFWFNIINTYRESSPPTVCLCLDVIGAYVSWIDINLITNDSIMSNLFALFSCDIFRCSVTDCFNSILRKGMDPLAKTQIIENFLNIEHIKTTLSDIFVSPSLYSLEFIEKIASLVNTIGIELMEAFKRLKSKSNNTVVNGIGSELQALPIISNAIESKFSLLCQFLSYKNLFVSHKVHPFARDYVQWLKNTWKDGDNSDKTVILLSIIIEQNKCLSDSVNSEDEFFTEFRKSTKVLFDNLLLLNPGTVLAFICDKVVGPTLLNWKSNSMSFSEIEVALYHFYLIGENINLIGDVKRVENLVQLLVTSSISSFPHSVTQSFYFDLIFRYEKFFNTSLTNMLSHILISFLDERGLRNTNLKIRSKVCKLFNKFVKSYVKSKSNNQEKQHHFFDDILKRLQDFVKLDIVFDSVEELIEQDLEQLANSSLIIREENVSFAYSISTSDQLAIYETVAFLIISSQHYDVARKRELLESLLQNVWDRFSKLHEEISSLTSMLTQNGFIGESNKNNLVEKRLVTAWHLSHLINLVSATSKSFSNVTTVKLIGAQYLYLHSFEVFLKAMSINTDADTRHILQSSIRHFLHRLIVCLDQDEIVPLLPNAIQTLFLSSSDITAKSLQELIPLFSQIIPKYKHSWLFQRDIHPFLAQIFSPLIGLYFKLICETNIESDKMNLQKSYYNFLYLTTTNDLASTFFDLDGQLIQEILGSLLIGAEGAGNPDPYIQRICFQIISKLVETYGNDLSQMEKQNRVINSLFVQFVYTSLVPTCLVVASKHSDDFHTVQEALLCLRKLNSLLGDEFVMFLRLKIFPTHFATINNTEELVTLLLLSDLKASKKTIKQVLQQFK